MLILVSVGLMVGLASEAALASTASAATQILSEAPGLNANVLSLGLDAYLYAKKHGVAVKKSLLTIVDYSLPSSQKRLWVIDLKRGQVLNTLLVAQGKNTGYTQAKYFSNQDSSLKSSIGVFLTGDQYYGKHGKSMRLNGLDKGYNDHARQRGIVVHAASYVTEAYVQAHGRVGNSWGCLAVDPAISSQLIDELKGGSLIFSYYPDENYLAYAPFLKA